AQSAVAIGLLQGGGGLRRRPETNRLPYRAPTGAAAGERGWPLRRAAADGGGSLALIAPICDIFLTTFYLHLFLLTTRSGMLRLSLQGLGEVEMKSKRTRLWSNKRFRLMLTLELAVMLPAAALIYVNFHHLKEIKRDNFLEAAIHRDFQQ